MQTKSLPCPTIYGTTWVWNSRVLLRNLCAIIQSLLLQDITLQYHVLIIYDWLLGTITTVVHKICSLVEVICIQQQHNIPDTRFWKPTFSETCCYSIKYSCWLAHQADISPYTLAVVFLFCNFESEVLITTINGVFRVQHALTFKWSYIYINKKPTKQCGGYIFILNSLCPVLPDDMSY